MNVMRARAGLIFFAVALSGCVGASMHSLHPVRVVVTKEPESAPVAALPLLVRYSYDSYGWFYFFNTPDDETAVTDEKGVATMNLATYRYRILLKVANNSYESLTKQMILEGGVVSSPPYKVRLSPQ